MLSLLNHFYQLFWDKNFWLSSNIGWDYLDKADAERGIYYPRPFDLICSVILAFVVTFMRTFIERYIWKPIGIYYKLKDVKVRRAPECPKLENVFKKEKRPTNKRIYELSKLVDWNVRKVERWFHLRRNQEKSSLLTKFSESGWRFTYYVILSNYGIYMLYTKDYFWNRRLCFRNHPFIAVSSGEYWYYMIGLAYYLSSTVMVFTDVKRKDFLEMVIHHFSTMFLMWFSWCGNQVRIGCLVLCLHDVCDHWMELAKMCKYIGKHMICNVFFVIFTCLWFITRLFIFPCYVIYAAWFDSYAELGFFWTRLCTCVLLCVLQVLHVIWFVLILKIAMQFITKGNLESDSRSESEMSERSDSEFVNNDIDSSLNHGVRYRKN